VLARRGEPNSFGGLRSTPFVDGLLARLAAKRLDQAGSRMIRLLEQSGIQPVFLEDLESQVSARSQTEFLKLAAADLRDDLLGFHIALNIDLRELGPFYYLIASSDTLLQAIDTSAQYDTLIREGIHLRYRLESALLVICEHSGLDPHPDRHQMEFWMTCIVRLCRQLTRSNITPDHIGFTHETEANTAEMEVYFACPLHFEAECNQISFEHRSAQLALAMPDPYLNRIMRRYYGTDLEDRRTSQEPLRARVESSIMPRLMDGTAVIGNVADDLNMSQRTLSRRLAEEGLTFSGILDELRLELAMRHLKAKDASISEIAWLLGYKELSSFVHAFQRWTGKTPTEVRRSIRSPDPLDLKHPPGR